VNVAIWHGVRIQVVGPSQPATVLSSALRFVKHVGALISASKRWIRTAKLDRLFLKEAGHDLLRRCEERV
jgi:hypothetical protein